MRPRMKYICVVLLSLMGIYKQHGKVVGLHMSYINAQTQDSRTTVNSAEQNKIIYIQINENSFTQPILKWSL